MRHTYVGYRVGVFCWVPRGVRLLQGCSERLPTHSPRGRDLLVICLELAQYGPALLDAQYRPDRAPNCSTTFHIKSCNNHPPIGRGWPMGHQFVHAKCPRNTRRSRAATALADRVVLDVQDENNQNVLQQLQVGVAIRTTLAGHLLVCSYLYYLIPGTRYHT